MMTKEQYLELLEAQFKLVVGNKYLPTDPTTRMAWLAAKPHWLAVNGKMWEASEAVDLASFIGWVNNMSSAAVSISLSRLMAAETIEEYNSSMREAMWSLMGLALSEEQRKAMHMFADSFSFRMNMVLEAKRQSLLSPQE